MASFFYFDSRALPCHEVMCWHLLSHCCWGHQVRKDSCQWNTYSGTKIYPRGCCGVYNFVTCMSNCCSLRMSEIYILPTHHLTVNFKIYFLISIATIFYSWWLGLFVSHKNYYGSVRHTSGIRMVPLKGSGFSCQHLPASVLLLRIRE